MLDRHDRHSSMQWIFDIVGGALKHQSSSIKCKTRQDTSIPPIWLWQFPPHWRPPRPPPPRTPPPHLAWPACRCHHTQHSGEQMPASHDVMGGSWGRSLGGGGARQPGDDYSYGFINLVSSAWAAGIESLKFSARHAVRLG